MIFDDFVLTVVGMFILLILLERLWNEFRSHWRRRVILRKYAHTEQIVFTLHAGETIVGVREEKGALCFYVGRDISNNWLRV
jgi:hypothetical protein